MKKTLITIALSLVFISYGQNNNDIKEIKHQISEINKLNNSQQNKIVELEEIKSVKNNFETKLNHIDTVVESAQKREDNFLTYIQWFFTVVGAVLLLFLGGSFWEFRSSLKKINEEAKKKIDESSEVIITKTVNELKNNKKHIKEIVDNNIWEFRLMAKSNIIVVNPNNENDSKYLNPVLKWFKEKGGTITIIDTSFDNPNDIINNINKNKSTSKLNIVLLENSDGNWNFQHKNIKENDPDRINKEKHNKIVDNNFNNAIEIASKLPKDCMLLYFGPGSSGFFPTKEFQYGSYRNPREIINRISFTNAPSKLYSNIIDTLKYMDIINPENNA